MSDDSRVPEMFDRISPHYDFANRVLSFGLDLRWRRALARHLAASSPFTLLDIATGTGDQITALFDQGAPISSAVGIDLSEGMLQIARQKISQKSYRERVSFSQADAEALPFPDSTFDRCTFSFGIRNVKEPLAALSELFRVTKPRGRCLILEFSLPKNAFRAPYLFYLRHLLPRIGGLITRDPPAYRYLNQTIEQFASGEAFLNWMRQTGWSSVTATPFLFGAVTLYSGEKRA